MAAPHPDPVEIIRNLAVDYTGTPRMPPVNADNDCILCGARIVPHGGVYHAQDHRDRCPYAQAMVWLTFSGSSTITLDEMERRGLSSEAVAVVLRHNFRTGEIPMEEVEARGLTLGVLGHLTAQLTLAGKVTLETAELTNRIQSILRPYFTVGSVAEPGDFEFIMRQIMGILESRDEA